jgi:DNA-binding transcriptional regulator YhcF (GntR family)
MMIFIDRLSPEVPHEQLTRQLTKLIADQALAQGSRLPTVRQLAADLGLAPNTVARCFTELERAGLIITNGRNGTTVSAGPVEAHARLRNEITRAAEAFANLVRLSGVSSDDAIRAVRSAIGNSSA